MPSFVTSRETSIAKLTKLTYLFNYIVPVVLLEDNVLSLPNLYVLNSSTLFNRSIHPKGIESDWNKCYVQHYPTPPPKCGIGNIIYSLDFKILNVNKTPTISEV